MITFLDLGSDKIVGMHVDEELTDEEFDAIKVLLEERLREFSKLRLYIELEGYEGMSLKSYFKDWKFGIKHWDRFEKSAVVTQKEWISKMASVADDLFSTVEMKAFSFDEKDKARQWIEERSKSSKRET